LKEDVDGRDMAGTVISKNIKNVKLFIK